MLLDDNWIDTSFHLGSISKLIPFKSNNKTSEFQTPSRYFLTFVLLNPVLLFILFMLVRMFVMNIASWIKKQIWNSSILIFISKSHLLDQINSFCMFLLLIKFNQSFFDLKQLPSPRRRCHRALRILELPVRARRAPWRMCGGRRPRGVWLATGPGVEAKHQFFGTLKLSDLSLAQLKNQLISVVPNHHLQFCFQNCVPQRFQLGLLWGDFRSSTSMKLPAAGCEDTLWNNDNTL